MSSKNLVNEVSTVESSSNNNLQQENTLERQLIPNFQEESLVSSATTSFNEDAVEVEDKFIVSDADIQNKQGNYIFTVGNISSGKSTIQNIMVDRLWAREDVTFKYVNRDGDARHAAILDHWRKELNKGNLPKRTEQGEIQEFSISFGQTNKKDLELNFLEISGEDIKYIVPTMESKLVKGFNKQLDEYLNLTKVNKRFIFVSDANVNRKQGKEVEESEDILFFHLLEHLLGKQGLGLKKIEVLFVVAKWDIVQKEYSSVKEYVQKHFPQTRSILTTHRCTTVYIPFSVGRIEEVKNSTTKEIETKIISLEAKYVDRLIHWIYYTYTNNTLKNFPKIVPSFFDKIVKVLRIS